MILTKRVKTLQNGTNHGVIVPYKSSWNFKPDPRSYQRYKLVFIQKSLFPWREAVGGEGIQNDFNCIFLFQDVTRQDVTSAHSK